MTFYMNGICTEILYTNNNIMIQSDLNNLHKWCQVSDVIVIQYIPNESITSKNIPLMRSVFCSPWSSMIGH